MVKVNQVNQANLQNNRAERAYQTPTVERLGQWQHLTRQVRSGRDAGPYVAPKDTF